MRRVITFMFALAVGLAATAVQAAVLRVPGSADTVDGAVAIANPGDTIEVGAGRWCGALITKRLNLVGHDDAVIVGVRDGQSCPVTTGTLGYRVGFHLKRDPSTPGDDPSGTTIRHFRFEGSAATDQAGLGLAVYGDSSAGKVNGVVIEKNKVRGTFYAFKNAGGDGWVIRKNHVRDLAASGTTGGAAIVITQNGGLRPSGNSVTDNKVRGRVPSALSGPWFTGVTVAGAVNTTVSENDFRVAAPAGQAAPRGTGVLVTSGPGTIGPTPTPPPRGGGPVPAGAMIITTVPGSPSQNTTVTRNDGEHSDFVLVVDGSNETNTSGLFTPNRGAIQIEGQLVQGGHARDRWARAGKGQDEDDDED